MNDAQALVDNRHSPSETRCCWEQAVGPVATPALLHRGLMGILSHLLPPNHHETWPSPHSPEFKTKSCGSQSPQSLVLLFSHRMCTARRDFRDFPPQFRLKLHELKIYLNLKTSFGRTGKLSFIFYEKHLHGFSDLHILSIGKIYHQTEILPLRVVNHKQMLLPA